MNNTKSKHVSSATRTGHLAWDSHSGNGVSRQPMVEVRPKENILKTIGGTPLVRFSRLLGKVSFNVFGKLEALNPGGSIKDRPAAYMIERALATGAVKPGSLVIESSSGNMGVGLAQACRFYGLRFICVVDPRTNQWTMNLLKAYGANVEVVTEPDSDTNSYLGARLKHVESLLKKHPDAFWPNQYASTDNAAAHYYTMAEICRELNDDVTYLLCPTSTCGTVRGCADYIREKKLTTTIIAVDAAGSILFGGKNGPRLIPGYGSAIRPALYSDDLAGCCIKMTDLDCVDGCRRLLEREAVLAGGSSGAVAMAAERLKSTFAPHSNCVLILPDRGERYLDTIYSDEWVARNITPLSAQKDR